MGKETKSGILFSLLLISILTLAFNIRPVRAIETIYIRSDGSVDPPTAPIQRDGDLYVLTDNIVSDSDGIVVERDNIVIDGAGYTLEGTGMGTGINLSERNNVTIKNMEIRAFTYGIWLWSSSNNSIFENTVTDNSAEGVYLFQSSNNVLSGNNITNNRRYGVWLRSSSSNTFSGNNITNNTDLGIYLSSSSDENSIFGNKIANNGKGIWLNSCFNNSFSENEIANHSTGVRLWYSSNDTFCSNNITNNGYGIYLTYSPGNIFSWNRVTKNGVGTRLDSSSGNTFSGNNVTNNSHYGIFLLSSDYAIVSGNTMANNEYGIYVDESPGTTVSGNNITNNTDYGILLYLSSNVVLRSNIMTDNRYNFGVIGYMLSHYAIDVDTSNSINGNPIHYLVNKQNHIVDPQTYPDIGYLAVVNSTNVIVRNLNIENNGQGVLFAYTRSSLIENVSATSNSDGIKFHNCSNVSISETTIANNEYGINLGYSSTNALIGNTITNNTSGVWFDGSFNNTIFGNTVSNNYVGIELLYSSNNSMYHNNFINNTDQVYTSLSVNVWDNDYPSGGNYWSNYAGVDLFSGPYQNETGSDGIGDAPYIIYANNTDRYPLMKPYGVLHDIGITNVATSKTVVGRGYGCDIDIMIVNYGVSAKTFNVTVYANTTVIQNFTNIVLMGRNSTTVTFKLNTTGFAYGNYTVSAVADAVPGEADTTDNTYVDGWIMVTIPGDIWGDPDDSNPNIPDGDVDRYDFGRFALAYGYCYPHPKYDPNADLNCDGCINRYDFGILALNYAESI